MTAILLGGLGDKMERDTSGEWPAMADGGYPFIYYAKDGGTLCAACANQRNGSLAHEDETDPQWRLYGADIFYEGEPQTCDHCGNEIESAYGDPDAE